MARCDTCMANKVCDHNKYGFENCGNYIPIADVVPKSEVKNIFEEIEKSADIQFDEYGLDRSMVIIYDDFAELKKKYTEDAQ